MDMRTQIRPLLFTQNNDRDPAAREILLVAKILVGSEQQVKPSAFGRF